MNLAPRQWLRSLHDKLPEPRVHLAPGHLFFSQEVVLDPSMSEEEIDDFVNLSIEGLSPFPVDQLTWGYLRPQGSNEAFVYATPTSRLRSQTEDELEEYFHVFPSFVAALREEPATTPTIRFLSSGDSLTALYFEQGKRLPHKIHSRPLKSADLEDSTLLEARDGLAAKIEMGDYELEEGLWQIERFFVGKQNAVYSSHRIILPEGTSESVERPVELTDRQLQAADVRNTALTTKNLKDRQLARKLWTGMQIIAACFILLLLVQFTVWGLTSYTAIIEKRFEERERVVDQVLQREDFIQRLSLDSLQSADPALMLSVINDNRPDSIYFTEAEADSIDTVTVKGISQVGAERVNLYEESLRSLPIVRDVQNTPSTKDSQTSFEITVTFDVIALAAKAQSLRPAETPTEGDSE